MSRTRLAATLLIAAALLAAAACSRVAPSGTAETGYGPAPWYRTPDPTGTALYKGIGPGGGSGVETY